MKVFFLIILAGLSIFFLTRGQEQNLESILTLLPASLRSTLEGWFSPVGNLLKPLKDMWNTFLGEEVKTILSQLGIFLKKEAEHRKNIFREELEKEIEELGKDFSILFKKVRGV